MTQPSGSIAPVSPAATAPLPEQRACLFSLAGARFAVDVRNAREAVLFDERTAVPLAPRHLVGVANLRGTVMPIVDVRGLLGLPGSRPGRSVQTLVIRDGGVQAAMMVDTVFGLERFDAVVPVDGPGTARLQGPRPVMTGWIRCAGETLALLDIPRILTALRPARPVGAQEVSV